MEDLAREIIEATRVAIDSEGGFGYTPVGAGQEEVAIAAAVAVLCRLAVAPIGRQFAKDFLADLVAVVDAGGEVSADV